MSPMGTSQPPEPTSTPLHPSLVRRTTESQLDAHKSPDKYKVYPLRWLILATCCVLALSNSMQWMSYTTLTDQTNSFYCHNGSDCEVGFWTSQIFQGVAVVTGLGGMYITDHYGIRLSITLGVTLNLVGSLIRLISSIPLIHGSTTRQLILHSGTLTVKYYYFLGSVIVAAAQAFFLVLPSKIAECWFSEDQRALANVLTFVANPFGVVLGTLIPTYMFSNLDENDQLTFKDSWMLFYFNGIMSLLTICNAAMAACISRGMPKTPPSPANAVHSVQTFGFWESIKRCLLEKQFVLQLFTFGLAFAQLWSVMIFVPDVLSAQQYQLTGQSVAVCAFVGVLASLLAGYICDKKKCFKEIIKISAASFFISAVLLRLVGVLIGSNSFQDLAHASHGAFDDVLVLLICGLLGASSIPQFPIGIEMGVETTFPVLEATSSGLLVIGGQLCMFALTELYNRVRLLDWIYPYNPLSTVKNWQLALDVWCVISFFSALMAIIFLNPYYKRVAFEQTTIDEAEQQANFGGKETEIIERM